MLPGTRTLLYTASGAVVSISAANVTVTSSDGTVVLQQQADQQAEQQQQGSQRRMVLQSGSAFSYQLLGMPDVNTGTGRPCPSGQFTPGSANRTQCG